MKVDHIERMFKGWFIGNFEPTALKTNEFEIALKQFKAGDYEDAHFHKIATEITLFVKGKAEMSSLKFQAGDIVTIYPNEVTDFKALTDVTIFVIKYPGVNNDKYLDE